MYPHRIRLRGPWGFEPLSATRVGADGVRSCAGDCPPPGKLKIPTSWAGTPLEGLHGSVRFRRTFRKPGTLDPDEHLRLVFGGVDYFAHVRLNGVSLGDHGGYFEPFGFDITPLVRPHNQLIVDVDRPREIDEGRTRLFQGNGDGAGGGIHDDVTLEVRPGVRLSDVRVLAAPRGPCTPTAVSVTGNVVGEVRHALTLDFSLNSRHVGHQQADAAPAGAAFRFDAITDPLAPWTTWDRGTPAVHELRIELHGGARTLDSRIVQFGVQSPHPAADHDAVPTNLIPHLLPAETWAQRVATLREQKVTWVRAPGRVLPTDAYDALDRTGISVWQDFPVGPSPSTDRDVVAEATRQARAMVGQLRRHPSIATWCCGAPASSAVNVLHEAVRQAIQQEDPLRPCALLGPGSLD